MNKTDSKAKKEDIEEPLIDQSSEGLKKLILKGKKKGFLNRNECEKALENEKFEDKDEFYSKVESLNIQIYDEENEDNSSDEANSSSVVAEKEEDTGRTSSITQYYIDTPNKVVGFFDLAGHERYLKTTMCGLNGCYIDYAMITIGVDRGIIGMAKEHLAIAVALKIPIFVVVQIRDFDTSF